jgi:rhodanese-related sulfurtransferase
MVRIPRDKLVAVVCHRKIRASIAYTYLLSEGFDNVKILDANAADIADKINPGLVKKLKGSNQ